MKLAIGGDHAGYDYKKEIVKYLEEMGHEVKDFGPYSADSCDYPDYIHPVADAVENGLFELAIIICGSGNGVAMTANKHQGIRCALAWNDEIAQLARSHNNANIISIPARYVTLISALDIVNSFVNTEFKGGRHQKRIDKIPCLPQ